MIYYIIDRILFCVRINMMIQLSKSVLQTDKQCRRAVITNVPIGLFV